MDASKEQEVVLFRNSLLRSSSSISISRRRPIEFRYFSDLSTGQQANFSQLLSEVSQGVVTSSIGFIVASSLVVSGLSLIYSGYKTYSSAEENFRGSSSEHTVSANSFLNSDRADMRIEHSSSPFSFSLDYKILKVDKYTFNSDVLRYIDRSSVEYIELPNILQKLYMQTTEGSKGSVVIVGGIELHKDLSLQLTERNIYPALFINPFSIGEEGYMDWDEILSLKSRGVQINALVDIVSFSGLSKNEILFFMKEAKIYLDDRLGQYTQFLYYPEGVVKEQYKQAAKEAGFLGAIYESSSDRQNLSDLFALKANFD